MAGRWGAHKNQNIEFGGPAQVALSLDARRTLSTMCAELSTDFATREPDDRLIDHMKARTDRPFFPTMPDADADYLDVRTIHLDDVAPYVSGIDGVIHNTQPWRKSNDYALPIDNYSI
jgi:3-isopropylmalate/(R)-2-methylmalate dehydratase large subunit